MIPVVFVDRARDTKSDEIVALKKVRMDKEKDGKSFGGCVHVVMVVLWSRSVNLYLTLVLLIQYYKFQEP